MMKRIAIPVNNGMLSEYFDKCNHYEIFELRDNYVVSDEIEVPPKDDLFSLPQWVANHNITDVVAYKVDKSIINLFSKYKINLFVGIAVQSPQLIVEAYMMNNLKSDENIISQIIA
ncbi:MAG: hypothetical protein JW717_11485 [Marinilabiliaceae bacterium]|nr:hypothetical protein [Marinilabiliaceae bacterium]